MALIPYATIEEIRMKAGFEKASNLDDRHVRAARRDAQAEIDAALGGLYTVPFLPNEVPEKIRTLTIKLAAYTLKYDAFEDVGSSKALEALRKQLAGLASGETPLIDAGGNSLYTAEGVTGYFGDAERMFRVEDRF